MVYEVRYSYYNMRKKYSKFFKTREEAIGFIEEKKTKSKAFESTHKKGGANFRYFAGNIVLQSIGLITRKTLVLYNPHPQGKTIGDCARRALTIFLDKDYNEVKTIMTSNAKRYGENYNAEYVLNEFMKRSGYVYTHLKGMDTYEVIKKYRQGTYIIDQVGHWVALKDGEIYDTGSQAYETKIIGIWRK